MYYVLNFLKGKYFKRKYLIWTLTIFFNGILNVFEKILYFNKSRFENSGKNDFVFIISTYDPRLLTFTIPLVKNLKTIFPDTPLNIIVNKDKSNEIDWDARSRLLSELSKYKELYLHMNNKPMGLAYNWNTGMFNSLSKKMIVMNDDIKILDLSLFEQEIKKLDSELESTNLIKVDNGWAFFAINNKCLLDLGFFDERFFYVNYEDSDYEYRYINFYKENPKAIYFESILHTNEKDGKVELEGGLTHSLLNRKILDEMYIEDDDGIKGQFRSKKSKIVEELFTYPTYSLLVENIDKIQNFDDYKNEFKNKLDYKKTKDE